MDISKLKRTDPARGWNVLYSYVVENMDKKDRARFESDLFRRPPGVSSRRRGDKFDSALESAAAAYLKTLEQQALAIDS